MSRPDSTARLLELLNRAYQQQPPADGPHCVDDQELMARWSADRLTAAETDQVLNHLSLCAECREVLATLIETDVWELPPLSIESDVADNDGHQEVHEDRLSLKSESSAASNPTAASPTQEHSSTETRREQSSSPPQQRRRFFSALLLVGAAAAAIALAMLWVPDPQPGPQLALLEHDFLSGRLDRDLDYSLAGVSRIKDVFLELPEPSAEERRWLQEFPEAIAGHPDLARELHEKWGQLLLRLRRHDEAREQFANAIKLEESSPQSHNGLGMIAFEYKQYAEARKHFEDALQYAPDDESVRVNLAITLQKLEQLDAALEIWQSVYGSSDDPQLKSDIESDIPQFRQDSP